MFDTFRGLLMWCIPISHFTRVAGHFSAASLSGIVYITINVFVMQAFVFLSGYFSKKPDRARETAFHTFLWPYILCIPFFYLVRTIIWGHATINLTIPPFALWYLFALFFYRFFLKNYIKIPHFLELSLIVFLFAGQVPFFSDEFALGRMVSYFPFFLLGYYCTPEHLKKIRSLRKSYCVILAAVLVACSCLLAFFGDQFPVGYYLLKNPACELGMSWFWDIVGRMMIFCLACGWIILMLNILPNKKNYVAYVGMNTMPIYILHLIVRYEIKKHGITFGIFPDNVVVYYILIFGFASLCVFVFSSKPVVKGYDFVVEGSYKILLWCLDKIKIFLAKCHIPVRTVAYRIMEFIEYSGKSIDEKRSRKGEASWIKPENNGEGAEGAAPQPDGEGPKPETDGPEAGPENGRPEGGADKPEPEAGKPESGPGPEGAEPEPGQEPGQDGDKPEPDNGAEEARKAVVERTTVRMADPRTETQLRKKDKPILLDSDTSEFTDYKGDNLF